MASVCRLFGVYALTRAGGGDLLFRFLVQFSPAAGGPGAADRHRCVWGALPVFRPHWVCPAQGCLCFPVYTAQAPGCSTWSGACAECGSSFRVLHNTRGFGCACVLCLPRPQRFRQPEAWAASPRVRRVFFLCGERPRQPEAWAHFPRMRHTFSVCGPSALPIFSIFKLDNTTNNFSSSLLSYIFMFSYIVSIQVAWHGT